MRYKVAVSIINYNSSEHTLACIKSVIAHTEGLSYQIVVVDNNSSDEDLALLEAGLPDAEHISLHRSMINLGFSGGHMLAAQFCDADFLYVLNNDCLLLNNNLKVLSDFMEATPGCKLCVGQFYDRGGERACSFLYPPSVRYYLLGSGVARFFNPAQYPARKKRYVEPVKVPCVVGSAMFFDFEALLEVGGLDTSYFLYCEEEDIAIKMAKKGYQLYMVPEAKFEHYGGGSTVKSYEITREYYISLFLLFQKHYSLLARMLFTFYFFLRNLRKGLKDRQYLRIALFLLKTDKPRYSLRHVQKGRFRRNELSRRAWRGQDDGRRRVFPDGCA